MARSPLADAPEVRFGGGAGRTLPAGVAHSSRHIASNCPSHVFLLDIVRAGDVKVKSLTLSELLFTGIVVIGGLVRSSGLLEILNVFEFRQSRALGRCGEMGTMVKNGLERYMSRLLLEPVSQTQL